MASAIVERVNEDLKEAMKARDAAKTGALRMLRAAFIELSKSGKGEVTDEDALGALRRLRKQREESALAYEGAGRAEQAAAERAEMDLIDGYLPRLADEPQTLVWVREAIAAAGATSKRELGKVMGALNREHKGQFDNAVARAILDRELEG